MVISLNAREAFFNLISAKMRSFLAVLGILVGTASVVAMVSCGQMATQAALKQFKVLGTGLMSFSINPNNQAAGKVLRRFTAEQAMVIKDKVPEVKYEAPYTSEYLNVRYQGHTLDGIVIGSTASLHNVIKVDVAEGRFISTLDGYNFYCVVGHDLANKMRQYQPHLLGTQVQLGKNIFTIVGVAKPWPQNGFFYQNINNSIIVPIRSSRLLSKYSQISNIVFYLKDNSDIAKVKAAIQAELTKLLPQMNFFTRSAKQIVESMIKQKQVFTLLLALIGSISLIVGGIGVMNIMLVSVVERKKEIGIRKALGARRIDIQTLFLIESVFLSLFGGFLGVVTGVFTSYVITLFTHWDFEVFFMPVLVGFSVSVAVGIFFGVYPAIKASRLNPIDCLRTE